MSYPKSRSCEKPSTIIIALVNLGGGDVFSIIISMSTECIINGYDAGNEYELKIVLESWPTSTSFHQDTGNLVSATEMSLEIGYPDANYTC